MRFTPPLKFAAVGVVLLIIAVVAAFAVPWNQVRERLASTTQPSTPGEHEAHDEHDDAPHAEGSVAEHVDISPSARANLGLKTGRIRLSDFVRTLHIPGEIVEAPGYSTADVPARVAGVVTSIHVAPGQAVRPGDLLFDLALTGEALAEAQSRLLDDVQQLITLDAELERLQPLSGGAIAEKQRLQVEYDRRRVEGQRNTRIQELLVRGLTRAQIDQILTNRELIQTVAVRVPAFPERTNLKGTAASTLNERDSGDPDDWEYTIETINVHPGESVAPEKSLARLARHTQLYVKGHAFEKDVPIVSAVSRGQPVSIEFGGDGHGGIDGPIAAGGQDVHGDVKPGLTILYLDNHVDPLTQTYAFYVPLENEVLRDSVDPRGRVYRSWKYKPGQRVHIRVPVGTMENRIVLPTAAVTSEGPEAYAFKLVGRRDTGKENADGKRLYAEEYERVPVVVDYRDRDSVVLAQQNGPLKVGDLIAMNRAYQLLLALKNASEGGAGHHHGHDH